MEKQDSRKDVQGFARMLCKALYDCPEKMKEQFSKLQLTEMYQDGRFVGYQSPKKADGSEPKTPRRDKTICKYIDRARYGKDFPFGFWEQGGGYINMIEVHAMLHGQTYGASFAELCKLMNMYPTERQKEEIEALTIEQERERKRKKRLDKLVEDSNISLIGMPQLQASQYLQRRYPKDYIDRLQSDTYKRAFVALKETPGKDRNQAINILKENNIAVSWNDYNLAIIWRDKYGNAIGANYPKTNPTGTGAKYQKPKDIHFFQSYLFGLDRLEPSKGNNDFVYLVEGEFDCLAMQWKGFKALAIGSNNLTEEALKLVRRAGYSRVVFVLDSVGVDSANFCNWINLCYNVDIDPDFIDLKNVEGNSDGKKYKDIDDYFKDHSAEDFEAYQLTNAPTGLSVNGQNWILPTRVNAIDYICLIAALHKDGDKGKPSDIRQVLRNIADYARHIGHPKANNLIKQNYWDIARLEYTDDAIISDDWNKIEKEIKREAEKQAIEEAKEELKNRIDSARSLEALRALTDTSIVRGQKKAGTCIYTQYNPPMSYDNYDEEQLKKTPKIRIDKYEFADYTKKDPYTNTIPLEIPTAGITFIGAQTSHGKSRFVQALTLDIAMMSKEEYKESSGLDEDIPGSVLLIVAEESLVDTREQLLANFSHRLNKGKTFDGHLYRLNIQETTKNGEIVQSVSDVDAIVKWRKGGKTAVEYKEVGSRGEIDQHPETAQALLETDRLFYEEYIKTRRIIVVSVSEPLAGKSIDDIDSVCELIRYFAGEVHLRAVCLDYIQRLSDKTSKTDMRHKELDNIGNKLLSLATELKIPIITAAQTKADSDNPAMPQNYALADSSDLARVSALTIVLHNMKFKPSKLVQSGGTDKELTQLQNKIDCEFGSCADRILATIAKNRGGRTGLRALLPFAGYAGAILPNKNKAHLRARTRAKELTDDEVKEMLNKI